jgi:hypothetical protein
MKNLTYIISLFWLMACDPNPGQPATEVLLVDLTGLDGCGWIFQLDNSERLEPTNLHDFKVELVDSTRYAITYEMSPNGSYCMVGDIIILQTIDQISN